MCVYMCTCVEMQLEAEVGVGASGADSTGREY